VCSFSYSVWNRRHGYCCLYHFSFCYGCSCSVSCCEQHLKYLVAIELCHNIVADITIFYYSNYSEWATGLYEYYSIARSAIPCTALQHTSRIPKNEYIFLAVELRYQTLARWYYEIIVSLQEKIFSKNNQIVKGTNRQI